MRKLTTIIDKMLGAVDKYSLGCNMDISAAKLSYSTMSGGGKDEN
jgi:hypothetical protein